MNKPIIPQRVQPVQAAYLKPEWAAKMAALQQALIARGVMHVGARKIVNACYGHEPEVILTALDRYLARGWSLSNIVPRMYRGILDPDLREEMLL